ncbi:MAG: hypothetical protein KDK70_43075, partial [Myxococcales bacterium]|nr:hypothetical protein [Myxococcales bacterium]
MTPTPDDDPTAPASWSPSLDEGIDSREQDTFLREVAAAPAVALPLADATLTAGTIVDGAFEILAPLGAGGMGTVYLAEHLELRRRVALKVHHRSDSAAA